MNVVRHLAATAKDGQTYTVVIEPGIVFQDETLFNVRVECKHKFGTDPRRVEHTNLTEDEARAQANACWKSFRERFNNK